MENKILSSKPITDSIYENIKNKLLTIENKPKLAILLVGDKRDSITYINLKRKKCKELGIESELYSFFENQSINHIIETIDELNNNDIIKGIIVQLPLPKYYTKNDEYKILNSVSPDKDIDGYHYHNVGNLTLGNPKYIPCTAEGCHKLLKYYDIPIKGKHIVFVGSSKVIAIPLAHLLLHEGATITLCNIHTENIKEITNKADILISCCGVPHLIDTTWIKENTIIIDVGINHLNDKIIGDVNFTDVLNKVKHITPVPGCIGPLTISVLIDHLMNNV